MRSLKYSLLDYSGMFKFLVRTSVNVFLFVNCLLPDRILQGELIVGVGFRDELRGVATVVASQQHDALRRVPGRVSQSGLLQCGGVRLPPLSCLRQLQAGGVSVAIDSATEDVPCESVPHSGVTSDGGKGKRHPDGGDVDLSLVVGGDQDACTTNECLMF